MNADAIPARVGKYRIDHVIGRGAIGIVYKGYDEQIDRPLAIKTVRPEIINEFDDSGGFLKRFANEAQSAARCLHPNIVTVFDLVEHERRPYIVMEYVNAGTLEDVIRSGTLIPIRQVGEVMAQILLALDHAHSKGVIHRDVKPSNILCPSAASIKVTDFGVARIDSLDLTGPHGLAAAGTPNYMAPERFLGRAADIRADLFSVGVILYQLLTGSKPFVAFDLPELMRKLLNENPPPVMMLRQELWTEIDAVVQKALARNPDDRFQSAERFIESLSAAIEARPHDNRLPIDLTELSKTSSLESDNGAHGEGLNASLATKLSSSTTDALSRTLAHLLGPVARVIVRQALQETKDIDSLVARLIRHIKTDADIAHFRQVAARLLRDDLGMASACAQETISDAEIDATVDRLIPAIGPIARHVVVKEARTAVGREDFYRRLADRIPDARERSRFLALRETSPPRKTH